jgi:hypothetical protein
MRKFGWSYPAGCSGPPDEDYDCCPDPAAERAALLEVIGEEFEHFCGLLAKDAPEPPFWTTRGKEITQAADTLIETIRQLAQLAN